MTNLGILLASVHKVTRKTVKFDSALPRTSFLIALNTHTHTHTHTHTQIHTQYNSAFTDSILK